MLDNILGRWYRNSFVSGTNRGVQSSNAMVGPPPPQSSMENSTNTRTHSHINTHIFNEGGGFFERQL